VPAISQVLPHRRDLLDGRRTREQTFGRVCPGSRTHPKPAGSKASACRGTGWSDRLRPPPATPRYYYPTPVPRVDATGLGFGVLAGWRAGWLAGWLAGAIFASYTVVSKRLPIAVPDVTVFTGITTLIGALVLAPAIATDVGGLGNAWVAGGSSHGWA
jgi:hypothetical protein